MMIFTVLLNRGQKNPSFFAGPPLRQNMIAPCGNIFDSKSIAMMAHHGPLLRTQSTVSESKDKYKTELCIPFMEHGKCEQVNCQFAHGEEDLRTVQRDSNYKTVLCKNFHSANGFCKHGSRCTYVHYEPQHLKKLKRSMSTGVQSMISVGIHDSSSSGKILPSFRPRMESASDGESFCSSDSNSSTSHSPNMSMDDETQDYDHYSEVLNPSFGFNMPIDHLAPYLIPYKSPVYYPSNLRSFRSSRLTSAP
jgi:hypothetical protein